jgi:hypothetical protein
MEQACAAFAMADLPRSSILDRVVGLDLKRVLDRVFLVSESVARASCRIFRDRDDALSATIRARWRLTSVHLAIASRRRFSSGRNDDVTREHDDDALCFHESF